MSRRLVSRRVAAVASLALSALAFAVPSSARAADTYKVDAVHSFVIFRVSHMNAGAAWGRFNEPTGTFTIDDADPTKSTFEASIKTESVDTGNPKRDQHLKSPDFFNANQFPEITFKSTAVKAAEGGYEVTGDLTLHGVTKSITVTVKKLGTGKGMQGETRTGLETEFTVKRSDYGMDKMVGPVGDEVKLMIALEGTK